MLYSKTTCVSLLLLLTVAPAACKDAHPSNEVQLILIGVVVVTGILFMIFIMKCITYMKSKQDNNHITRPTSPIAIIDMSSASHIDDPPPAYQEDLPPPYSSLVFYKVPALEPVVVKIPI
ncbi:hypothetical protein C0J52_19719 [Blattella germanica]|nr:hypothetical protein C0J52_19719 [Blattella germanica]